MNTSVKIIALLLGFGFSFDGKAQKLTVVITGVKDDKGKVGAAFYNSGDDFLKNEVAAQSVPAKKGTVKIIFKNIPAGQYAISVLQDTNGNNKMDTNLVGIPKEGYGFSNDATGMFGPPKFEKASFSYDGKDDVISISMKYF